MRATHVSADVARVDTAELVSTKRGDKLVLKSQSLRTAKGQQGAAENEAGAAGDKAKVRQGCAIF